MDFYLQEITRDHLDLDWCVCADAMPGLVDELLGRGWTDLAQYPSDQPRDIVLGEKEMGFAPLVSRRGSQREPTPILFSWLAGAPVQ